MFFKTLKLRNIRAELIAYASEDHLMKRYRKNEQVLKVLSEKLGSNM